MYLAGGIQYTSYFVNDFHLLKKAYVICAKSQQHFDHDGKDILQLITLDNEFLFEYIFHFLEDRIFVSIRDIDHLSALWQLKSAEYLIEKVFEKFADKKFYSIRENIVNAFFKKLSKENEERARFFLSNYMLANKMDTIRVNMVLDVFRNSFRTHYFDCIASFLKVNNNFQHFNKLELLSNHFSSNGQVSWSEVKATELENILNEISRLPKNSKYSQHKAYLRNRIIMEKRNAEMEKRERYMYDHW